MSMWRQQRKLTAPWAPPSCLTDPTTVNRADRNPEPLQGNAGLSDGLPPAQHPHQHPDFTLCCNHYEVKFANLQSKSNCKR